MILAFSTQMKGKPTYFIEKIWEGLLRHNFKDDKEYIAFLNNHEEQFGKHWDFLPEEDKQMTNPKLHSIREDATDRWQVGTKIDFFINCRQKDMFRFAPVSPVVSRQKIEIIYKGIFIAVVIDKILFYTDADFTFGKGVEGMLELAKNDGFDTIEDFFAYFNKDFTGKLIHWTDLKY